MATSSFLIVAKLSRGGGNRNQSRLVCKAMYQKQPCVMGYQTRLLDQRVLSDGGVMSEE